MRVTVLYPFFDHPAIEERYASWQTDMRLRDVSDDVDLLTYDPHKNLSKIAEAVADDHVIVVTDPILVPSPGLADRLLAALTATDAEAAIPVTNEAVDERQRRSPSEPYLTLRELEEVASRMAGSSVPTAIWGEADPGLFLTRTEHLDTMKVPAARALIGRKVAIAHSAYVHRWPSMRAIAREDLLPLISTTAKSILEIGCGEGALGDIVKKRQKCRYVGVELDPHAAAIARRRLDDVYGGDVVEIVSIIEEKFDTIVCSEIVEHVADPWSLMMGLRRACRPGGQIVISIPNIAHAAVINDLLQGRFDYAYIGLVCAGHLRFFTRRSIEELMFISGWQIESIVPQYASSVAADDLIRRLETAGLSFSKDDLLPTGFYVVGRNPAE